LAASSKKSLIIVPQPGQLLTELGAGGALGDAALAATAAASYKDNDGWAKPVEMDYTSEAFKKQYLGEFPSANAPGAKAQSQKLNEAIFEHLGPNSELGKSAINMVNDFTRTKMREDGFFRKILPPLDVMPDALDQPSYSGNPVKADKGDGVDVVFWYYRDTQLIYSIRRVSDNFFYDFASKKFSLLPVAPRAGMPRVEPARPAGYVYSTKLSGKLDDGEYVATFRDTKALDVVVGIMAVFMQSGAQTKTPPQGLEDTPIEAGIPVPGGFHQRAKRIRLVDIEGSE
jgi:hypothetical protein